MTPDFAALMYGALPGLHRDQDTEGELRAFLDLVSEPLAELHESITALYGDMHAATCRPEFISLVGSLVGAEVDASFPEQVRRNQVLEALDIHRKKGTAEMMLRKAEQVSAWRVHVVDGSASLTRLPILDDPDRVVEGLVTVPIDDLDGLGRIGRVDDRMPCTVDVSSPQRPTDRSGRAHPDARVFFCTPASVHTGVRPARLAPAGAFTFAAVDTGPLQLIDGYDASPLTRVGLAADIAAYAGTSRGFTFRIGGTDLGPEVIAADLSDPGAARHLDGSALAPTGTQIAVDPETGRFQADPATLAASAGELTVDYLLAAAVDADAEARIFADLATHLPRVMPAAITLVLADTRHRPIDPVLLP